MGCINSSNKQLYALKRDDIFNVSVVRVQSEQSVTLARQGFLEITPHELIFIAPEQEPIAWALQHLRRYGLTGNVFSFEAGRRCATGPGIYTFRCCNADQFYSKFQRYINSMSMVGDRINSSIHPSHIFGRLDMHQQHTNHYLEPTSVQIGAAQEQRATLSEYLSNDTNDMNLNSPDSMQSSPLTTEIIHFSSSAPSYSNVNPNPNLNSSNIYMEQPMRTQSEHNNNVPLTEDYNSLTIDSRCSMIQKPLLRSSSLDMPPDECAPILTPTTSEAQRLYANIETIGSSITTCTTQQSISNDTLERCYANVDVLARLDAPPISQSKSFQFDLLIEQQLALPSNGPIVNYIVLDLDQPRSPSQCSPKAGFGSGHSLSVKSGGNVESLKAEIASTGATSVSLSSGSATMPKGTTLQEDNAKLSNKSESSGSYTRIDFLKTFALMKSSTNYTDFDPDHDQEESRITRHSKFVRKAYSISE